MKTNLMNLMRMISVLKIQIIKNNQIEYIEAFEHIDVELLKSKTVKFKFNSSSGGHNGIKSIILSLNSQNFGQLKIGIGSTNNNIKDFVLGKLSKEELNFLQSDVFGEMINYYIENGIEKTMNKYNCKGD